MANLSLSICPHCGKTSKLIPLKAPPQPDPSGNFEQVAGSLFAPEPTPTPTVEKKNFWASDGITYSVAGLFSAAVLLTFGWYYDLRIGWLVATVALLVGIGLHVLKIWSHRPAGSPEPAAAAPSTTIRVEHISDDRRHWVLDQLDPSIKPKELQAVAAAVAANWQWTRTNTTGAGLSQGKHQKLQRDFLRLRYLNPLPNNAKGYTVTGRGRRFLRQAAGSPTP